MELHIWSHYNPENGEKAIACGEKLIPSREDCQMVKQLRFKSDYKKMNEEDSSKNAY